MAGCLGCLLESRAVALGALYLLVLFAVNLTFLVVHILDRYRLAQWKKVKPGWGNPHATGQHPPQRKSRRGTCEAPTGERVILAVVNLARLARLLAVRAEPEHLISSAQAEAGVGLGAGWAATDIQSPNSIDPVEPDGDSGAIPCIILGL